MQGIVFAIVALVIGLVLGWVFGSRPGAQWRAMADAREKEAREADGKYLRAFAELEAARERASRVDELTVALERARTEHAAQTERLRGESVTTLQQARSELEQAHERTRSEHAQRVDVLLREQRALSDELSTLREKTANFDEQKRLLIEAQEGLRKEFENAGAKVLAGAQEAFLHRAGARFEESEKASAERIATLLAPVGERLKSYELQVATLEKQRTDAFATLTGQLVELSAGQERVRAEAARLSNSLRNAPRRAGAGASSS